MEARLKWLNKSETPKQKSQKQEKGLAKKLKARLTSASGATPLDKADTFLQKARTNFEPKAVRIECKRTDKFTLRFEKEWIEKLKRETKPKEFWAMELEIQDEKVYVISEGEFLALMHILSTPSEVLIKELQEGIESV